MDQIAVDAPAAASNANYIQVKGGIYSSQEATCGALGKGTAAVKTTRDSIADL